MIKHSGATAVKVLSFACIVFLLIPVVVSAADLEFQPLVGIPGVGSDQTAGGFGTYINALYILAISIAGLLAVIKLIIAGTKYMLSDIVTQKQDAKNDIKGALIGLLIVLGAVIILSTINEDLLNTQVGVDEIENINNADIVLPEFITTAQQHCDNITAGGGVCRTEQCTSGVWDAIAQAFQSCEAWCAAQPNSTYVDRIGIARDSCIYDESMNRTEDQVAAENDAFENVEEVSNEDLAEQVGDDVDQLDESDLQSICEGNGDDWENNQCYSRANNIIPIPTDRITETDQRMFCSSQGLRFRDNPVRCINEQ